MNYLLYTLLYKNSGLRLSLSTIISMCVHSSFKRMISPSNFATTISWLFVPARNCLWTAGCGFHESIACGQVTMLIFKIAASIVNFLPVDFFCFEIWKHGSRNVIFRYTVVSKVLLRRIDSIFVFPLPSSNQWSSKK